MSFADYFGKNLQAASYLLQGIDPDAFKEILAKESIGIAFDAAAAQTAEGRKTLDLLIRLLARLYPSLAIVTLDKSTSARKERAALQQLAIRVNPKLDVSTSAKGLSQCIVVGNATLSGAGDGCKVLYVGSDNWLCKLSTRVPLGSGKSPNPFAAGAAACFAVANVFRQTFARNLPNPKSDDNVVFSVLDLRTVKPGARNPAWRTTPFGEVFLIGVGAIGNGFLWAVRDLDGEGKLHVVDHDPLDQTNVQRYAMTLPGEEGEQKVELAVKWLSGSKIDPTPHAMRWEDFVSRREDRRFDRVVVAVDTAEARINIQASLPALVHNSWTQRGEVGLSRHSFLGKEACMACLYIPTQQGTHYDQLVQRALRLPEALLQEVRRRLDLGITNERAFLEQIAGFGIPLEQLLPFVGKKLDDLYHQGACAGMVLALRDGEVARQIEVPMAFQSALAGILLAADVYAEIGGLRKRLPTRTQLNLLSALPPLSPSEHIFKVKASRCICADADFIEAYGSKYPRTERKPTTKQAANRHARQARAPSA